MSWLLDLLLFTGGLLALALLRGITITRLLKEWIGVAGNNLDELAPEWREAFFLQLVSGRVVKCVVRPFVYFLCLCHGHICCLALFTSGVLVGIHQWLPLTFHLLVSGATGVARGLPTMQSLIHAHLCLCFG